MNAETATTVAMCVGGMPFAGTNLPAGPATRAALRTWLIRCGMKSTQVMGLSVDVLRDAYSEPGPLAVLINKTVDEAMIAGQTAATSPYRPTRAPDVVVVTDATDETPKTETPKPAPRAIPATPDAQSALTDLAGALAKVVGLGGGVSALDEGRVIELIKAHANAPIVHVVEVKTETETKRIEGAQHPQLADLLRACGARMASGFAPNVWLSGPTGSGKTHACEQVAEALGLKFYMHGSMSMPHELLGFVDAAGNYHRTPFRDAFEHGGLCLLDEADSWDASVSLAANAALANGVMAFPDGMVRRHRDCIIIAAGNTFGSGATADFVGRNKLDAAFLSRFPVKIDWKRDDALETAIAGNPSWSSRVQKARAKAQAAGLKIIIDPRHSQAGAALIAAGFTAEQAAEMTYLAGLSAEQRRMVGG